MAVHQRFVFDTPSLQGLSYLLRHPDEWPKDFTWNYCRFDDCAVGLAARVWDRNNYKTVHAHMTWIGWAARKFEIDRKDARSLFMHISVRGSWWRLWRSKANVTPSHVADAIDAYLLKGFSGNK